MMCLQASTRLKCTRPAKEYLICIAADSILLAILYSILLGAHPQLAELDVLKRHLPNAPSDALLQQQSDLANYVTHA